MVLSIRDTDVMGVLGFKQQVFGGTGDFVLPSLIAYIYVEGAGKYLTCQIQDGTLPTLG